MKTAHNYASFLPEFAASARIEFTRQNIVFSTSILNFRKDEHGNETSTIYHRARGGAVFGRHAPHATALAHDPKRASLAENLRTRALHAPRPRKILGSIKANPAERGRAMSWFNIKDGQRHPAFNW